MIQVCEIRVFLIRKSYSFVSSYSECSSNLLIIISILPLPTISAVKLITEINDGLAFMLLVA